MSLFRHHNRPKPSLPAQYAPVGVKRVHGFLRQASSGVSERRPFADASNVLRPKRGVSHQYQGFTAAAINDLYSCRFVAIPQTRKCNRNSACDERTQHQIQYDLHRNSLHDRTIRSGESGSCRVRPRPSLRAGGVCAKGLSLDGLLAEV